MPEGVGLLVLTSLIFGVAFFFQSIFGFGAALISVLSLSLLVPTPTAIAMVPITMVFACALMVVTDLGAVDWKSGLVLFGTSIPGIIAGAFLIGRLSTVVVTILASGLILAYGLYSLVVGRMHIPRSVAIPVTVLSGAVVAVSGLATLFVPVMMLRVNEPRRLRVTLNLLWTLLAAGRIPIYLSQGLVSRSHLIYSMVALPAVFLALFLGRRVARRFSPESFRKALLVFLTLLAATRLVVELV